jgi:hypothetical protein
MIGASLMTGANAAGTVRRQPLAIARLIKYAWSCPGCTPAAKPYATPSVR